MADTYVLHVEMPDRTVGRVTIAGAASYAVSGDIAEFTDDDAKIVALVPVRRLISAHQTRCARAAELGIDFEPPETAPQSIRDAYQEAVQDHIADCGNCQAG